MPRAIPVRGVPDAGQLHDKSRGTCSLIAGQHFALVKLDLAREECDGEDCRSDRQRAKPDRSQAWPKSASASHKSPRLMAL